MVRPLSLSLESSAYRVMSDRLFAASFGKIGVSLVQVLDDDSHLGGKLPVLLLLLIGLLNEIGILVKPLSAVFLNPGKSFLVLILIIDVLFHAAQYLNFIN